MAENVDMTWDDSDFTPNFSTNMANTGSTTMPSYSYTSDKTTTPQSPSQFVPSNEEFQFVSTASSSSGPSISGSMSADASSTGPESDSLYSGLRSRGATSTFLENKGFGWLMEVDDDDEEVQKPLLEELDIDVKDIYNKLKCVLIPLPQTGFKRELVRDNPDFWGPLVVVLLYSLVSLYGQFRVVSWILTIWIFGSMLVFILARVLGGEVNYSQCLGVIGYSLLPLTIIALILPAFQSMHLVGMAFKFFGVAWATYSAGSLLCVQELQQKRALLLYPILLLYIYFLSLYTGA